MLKKVVIIPGGFHPFHAGHKALYDAAVAQFPKADVFIAATDDKSNRPFPFKLKKQLAGIAGIPAHRFVQVKSPFQPKEITGLYDPEDTQLIFVRSDKDSGVSPLPGGFKKDGSASYLQPLKRGAPENMKQHGFMTYLPTVQFGPGMTSATEIRAKWPGMSDEEKVDLISSLYPAASGAIGSKAVEIFNNVLAEEEEVILMPMGALEKPVDEGYKVLPKLDKNRYQERDGLEGPFMTRSGKVVYYDSGEGEYYDPDTDIYLTYDEWKALDGTDEMHEAQDSLMGVKDPVISISDPNGKPVDRLKMSVAAKKYNFNMNTIRPQFQNQEHVKHGKFTLSAPISGQPMETKIINKGDTVDIIPAGGMGSYGEEGIKSSLGEKLRTLADMLDDENYDNLEYTIYKSGAMESLVNALAQYQRYKGKRGNRPMKRDVEIDISNESGFSKEPPEIDQEMDSYFNSRKTEDYLPEDETLNEYVFQSRPLRVLDNIAGRKDVEKFPVKFDDGTQVMVSPKMAKKFMDIYLTKDVQTQKQIDQVISKKAVFIKMFNDLIKGIRTTGLKIGDIR